MNGQNRIPAAARGFCKPEFHDLRVFPVRPFADGAPILDTALIIAAFETIDVVTEQG
jgi:hypothetical protein